MEFPELVVIAGCNGSGKTTFSSAFSPKDTIPFDYDKIFLNFYRSLISSEFQDIMAHNLAFSKLEKLVDEAMLSRTSFCYETNFNSDPLYWPEKFRSEGFEVNLFFLCLKSVQDAIKRVAIRVENGGHHVPEAEIEKRFFEGYKNLNKYFSFFDNLHVFDCTTYNSVPQYCFSLCLGKVVGFEALPLYLGGLVPDLYKVVSIELES